MSLLKSKMYWPVLGCLFGIVVVATSPNSNITIFGAASAWYLGFGVIRDFCLGNEINFGWARVSSRSSSLERMSFLVIALAVIS
ncbi:hypothetical protein, partial [Biformimicrobium ophioploci]|uniref:hypothetical protein n=1 Tax=Biformimicrobium ophioploci TaxID=3036711 RepID=UPI0025570933